MVKKLISKYLIIYKELPIQVRASFWFLICAFLQKGISTITTPIFTRLLTTEEFGQYNVFNSWHQILSPIICLNLYGGVYSQGIVKFEDDRHRFTSSLQGLAFTLACLWYVIYIVSKSFWNNLFSLNTIQMICMIIIIWASSSFCFWSMDQRVDFKYRNLVPFTIISSLLQPVVSIFLIINSEDKVTARIVGMTLVQFVLFGAMFLYHEFKGKAFCIKKYWVYALKFNIPLLPHYLSMVVLSSSDRIMISRMVGDAEAGIYSLAYSVSLVMTMFNQALLQTLEPWIYRKLKEGKSKDIASVAYPVFAFIAVINILLILFAPEIIAFFAPESYKEAIWCIPAVSLSCYFMFLYTFFATFEFYYEKTNYIALASIGGAILNIILNYFCILLFGYVAAAYTTLVCYILFSLMHYRFMVKVCNEYLGGLKPYDSKIIIGISLLSLVAGFTIRATYTNNLIRYCLILLGVICIFTMRKKVSEFIETIMSIRKKQGDLDKT
ncbi:MAG TPA: oligosaccharide flippase family protein [Candidatus Fimimorpha faecalis]|uniref:Oligosaccharide flippase family protein n=1 Tax=Candidatus Fimimorpha faecalis TaxID=2840824 RepID=A0A9D1JBT6_9FIRM|nr:oligosaccharide flippase family protein [Candidatus Fimimorpha faecalis]